MKKSIRYPLYLLGILALFVTSALLYLAFYLPNVDPAPDISIELTDEKIDRGHYLAHHVMLCMDCHATRDWTLFSGPPAPGTEGAGGDIFDQSMGLPGTFVSRNITPFALADWTDGEIFRAITSGVNKDGQALFPIMPWPHYGNTSEEDIRSVIAYIRSLEPIENELPDSKADFPMNLILNTMPAKANLQPSPPKNDPVRYGRYLITAAACTDCHTRHEKGEFVGQPYAGGQEFRFGDQFISRAANITPHETGIGSWTKEQFINRFKQYDPANYELHEVGPRDFQSVMPWSMYAGMSEDDLGAIYEYLQTVAPADNSVEVFTLLD